MPIPLRPTPYPTQKGQASVEFIVAGFAVIACLTLTLALSHWFVMKQLFLLHAQRATQHGAMRGGQTVAIYRSLRQRLRGHHWQLGAVCVEDNVSMLLRDFKDIRLSRQRHKPLIRYNHLAGQQARARWRGGLTGIGRYSGRTIAQANILHVRSTAYLPITWLWMRPILGTQLKLVVHTQALMQSHREALTQQCMGQRLQDSP